MCEDKNTKVVKIYMDNFNIKFTVYMLQTYGERITVKLAEDPVIFSLKVTFDEFLDIVIHAESYVKQGVFFINKIISSDYDVLICTRWH